MKGLLTVKQYAEKVGVSGAAIRMNMKRGTIKYKRVDGLTYVYINSDKTIRKPRKKLKTLDNS